MSLAAAGTWRCRRAAAFLSGSPALPSWGERYLSAAGVAAGMFLRPCPPGWHCQAGLRFTRLSSFAAGSLQLICLAHLPLPGQVHSMLTKLAAGDPCRCRARPVWLLSSSHSLTTPPLPCRYTLITPLYSPEWGKWALVNRGWVPAQWRDDPGWRRSQEPQGWRWPSLLLD